jgi:hypothetical protein
MNNLARNIIRFLAGMLFIIATSASAQYPTGEQVMQQEIAKAQAEKAKNDVIVAKQREAEKASSDSSKAKKAPPKKSKKPE